jgi:hypothetical protein
MPPARYVQTSSIVPDSDADLVLSTRLALLRSSLATVGTAISNIEDTRQPSRALSAYAQSLEQLRAVVSDTVTKLRALDLGLEGERLLWELTKAQYDAEPEVNPDRALLRLQQTSVHRDLSEDVKSRLEELAVVEQLLKQRRDADSAQREQLLQQAWVAYVELSRRCESVFAEYLDLVRGVVLRDAGLDRDLCRIGDALGRPWGRFKDYEWQSFTIPASCEQHGMSAARLIRIGFPEWSIWCLSLTAHEFGQVFAAQHDDVREFVRQQGETPGVEDEVLQTWIADAFATEVMGPAYVWAAISLRTDPASDADHARVTVMLASLAQSDFDEVYAAKREQLAQAWAGARASVGAAPADHNEGLMRAAVERAHQLVGDPFDRSDWERSLNFADRLGDEQCDPVVLAGEIQPSDLRNILAGAWFARLARETAAAEPVGGLVSAIEKLAERARLTCIALIDTASGAGGADSIAPTPLSLGLVNRVQPLRESPTLSKPTPTEQAA